MLEAEADVGIGGQMKDKIASRHRADQRGQIQAIAFDQFELGICQRRLEKFALAGGKIVPADHLPAAGQQTVNQVTANKTGGAGDKDFLHYFPGNLKD